MKKDDIKKAVKENYGQIAVTRGSSCGCSCGPSCCGGGSAVKDISRTVGYSEDEMNTVPDGANLGLGCGNPVALASLKEGDVVLDLGSGAGFDCFLAARKVGEKGKVIGVDMTPEMVEKATWNAAKGGYLNVEFRLGEIECLPVADSSVDVIISNCVINLSPEKEKVFAEAFRVLKPMGRLMISDLVLLKELPDSVLNSVAAYVGCIAGAEMKDNYLKMIKDAGFSEVSVVEETRYPVEEMAEEVIGAEIKGKNRKTAKTLGDSVASIKVSALKRVKIAFSIGA